MHALFSFLPKGKQKIASLSVSPSPPHPCRTCCVLAFCIVSFYLPHLAEMIADYFTHKRVPDSWIQGPCKLQDSGLVSVTLSFIQYQKIKIIIIINC